MGLIKLLLILLIIYGIAGMIFKFIFREPDRFRFKFPYTKPALLTGIAGIMIIISIVLIGPQDVGVIVTPRGVVDEELHTGWHLIMPWNDVHFMDKTVWVYTCAQASDEGSKPNADAIWAPTKDGIKMGFDVSVSWRIIPNEASWLYQNVTENDGGNTGRYL